MAGTKIRGNTQILAASITDAEIAVAAAIALSKLAEPVIQADGGQAFTADQSHGGFKITNLGTPSSSTDATTKGYVDGVASGLQIHNPVRAATVGNITLSGAQTIDGVSVIATDRVLVKDQSAGQDNGIYVAAAGAWVRATDLDLTSELISGIFVFVQEGTVNDNTGWVLSTANPMTLGTTPQVWSQFSGAGQVIAGTGLTKSGNTLDVGGGDGITMAADGHSVNIDTAAGLKFDASSPKKVQVAISTDLEFSAGNLRLAAAVAGAGLTGGAGAALAVGAGTGLTVAADAIGITAGGVGPTELAASVAGNGLTGGGGSAINVVGGDGLVVAADLVSVGIDTSVGLKFDASSPKKLQVALDGTSLSVSASGLKVNAAKFITRETPTGLVNGANVTYTLASTPIAGTEQIFLNGLLQEPGAGNDYTISGGTITYLTAPVTGDRLRVNYIIA